MDPALKAEIQEIIELVKTIPDSLQLRTLELLLQDALDRAEGKKEKKEQREKAARASQHGKSFCVDGASINSRDGAALRIMGCRSAGALGRGCT
jgi:hypothetical protein